MIKVIDQILIIALAVDAGWVAAGLMRKRNMWWWIVLYWILLTLRNITGGIMK